MVGRSPGSSCRQHNATFTASLTSSSLTLPSSLRSANSKYLPLSCISSAAIGKYPTSPMPELPLDDPPPPLDSTDLTDQLCQAKVGDLDAAAVVKENVLRLDVAVDDLLVAAEVEVGEPTRRADGNVHPLLPFEHRAGGAEQGAVQGPTVHVFVYEHPAATLGAESAEAH
ncbi:hypothetical protein IEQ34_018429 [Dendrobium chrysotoxum]|uniref:Uncharacterized protein n=1 Tax=Dendrobium chrysotoxum TaxID=161865 RepID=A0AAV7G5X9_DENCH|nr:hypothetical protein IEQ34_018429 [Dendrobium chrysotoxum]